MIISYVQALTDGFPGVVYFAPGDGTDYNSIVWQGGDPIPPVEELDAKIVELTKNAMWKLIQAERDRRTQAGVQVGAYWFHSDQPSRIQQLGLVIMGANLPTGIMWKTMSGAFVEMTPTLAGQIFQSVASKDIAIFTVAEQHKALTNASGDPANYNYLTGSPAWPLVYGE
jgi:hypothetical protein